MEIEGVRDGPLAGASKALEGRKKESTTIIETRAKASKAHASMMESSMKITRLAMKAKVAWLR